MKFTEFATQLLQPLEQTSKKLEQTRLLAEFLPRIEVADVPAYVYLLLGQTGPVFDHQEFNFGRQFFLAALAEVAEHGNLQIGDGPGEGLFGRVDPREQLEKRLKELGDGGALAQEVVELLHAAGKSKDQDPTVTELFRWLVQLTQMTGEGSQEAKILFVGQMFMRLSPLSARYLGRILLGTLRLGFSDKTILDALSWYEHGDKSARDRLDEVYQRHPDVGRIAQLVREGGVERAETLNIQLGVPVLPALCDRLKTAQEMIDKMGEVIVEAKYDGTRLQIHWDAVTKTLRTFTRNLEENTLMFPELPRLLESLNVQSVILDAEAVGYDTESNALLRFQQTIKRKRKHDIEATMAAIPLRFFVFDVLLLNGESTIQKPLIKRKSILATILADKQSDLVMAPYIQTASADELREFHLEQLRAELEGAVVKQVNSAYQPGRKAFTWVKFKEAEGSAAKLADTIDAVVLGTYAGRGKRTAFGVGAFLIGVIDEQREQIVTIAKIGTGLSDEQWRELKTRVDALQAEGGESHWPVMIPEALQPDELVPARLVVEVAADEITRSPLHTAGVALRFPRLIRFRDDKSVEQLTTLAEVEQLSGLSTKEEV